MYQRFIKRCIDFILSGLATVVLAPFMLVFAIAIKADSRGPVLFKQKRVGPDKPGPGGTPRHTYFNILKFRTMYADTPKDVPTHLLEDPDSRITRMGRFLRKTSLDELPQIWNILAGQMSIIGPRPALWNQEDLVAERDKYGANALTPGLTGYAQINGRDELPIPVKAEYDGYYAKHISFTLDVKIFFGTIVRVFTARGVVEGKEPGTGTAGEREATAKGEKQ